MHQSGPYVESEINAYQIIRIDVANESPICLEERGRIGNGCSDSAVVKRLRKIEKLADEGGGWELLMGG